ncbi:pectinesterase family protein [Pontibacter akesuensis]|uniref:Pectinesterase n=1 Tax=Pontibacter akesuensis TaxID=388950 RepID=A0A1I7K5Q1_9BACT|nr:pectinesterase family protein [Pontibacter akesuensis]GHA74896.1 pectinesterase [Pontibacter akesuensis]SFU92720.1 pectinesterase [Pontibacter akesuensis]
MKRLSALLILCLIATLVQAQQGRVVVAQDGSGDYTSIQAAVDVVPSFPEKRVEIFIKNGIYREKIIIPTWKSNLSFIGEDKYKTIIRWDDHSGKGDINTFTSYTVLVQGNDFRAENITFENSAGRTVGQAVALHVEADRCVFEDCRIIGDQDTLYAGVNGSRQYYRNCYIEGTTDFIFGPATAVFENCIIHCKKNSYITAASTPEGQAFGFVFLNCTVTASEEATKVYLGRPWRPYAKTVFISTKLGKHIRPEGWHNWSKPEAEKTAFYAEYKSIGPGAAPKARVSWAKQLKRREARKYTVNNILSGNDGWKVISE